MCDHKDRGVFENVPNNVLEVNKDKFTQIWSADDPNMFNLFELDNDKSIEDIFMTDIYSLEAYDENFKHYKDINQNYICKESFINDVVCHFNAQRFLPIIGNYGSGKTILSKVLYKHLWKKHKVIAIGASELRRIINGNEFTKFKDYLYTSKIEYLFIDEMDDIDFKMTINNKTLNFFDEALQNILTFLKENTSLKVLINSRFLKSWHTSGGQCSYLALHFFDIFNKGVDRFVFISTSPITNENRQRWLLKFFDNKKEQVEQFLKSLKSTNKKLPNSLSNPLVLYITSRTYVNDTDNKNNNYVERIIDDTIRGKFKLEKKVGASALKYKMQQYKMLVYAICYDILKKSESDAYDINYDEKDVAEFKTSTLRKDKLFCNFESLSKLTNQMILDLKNGNYIHNPAKSVRRP